MGVSYIVSVGFIFYVVDSLLHFNNWRSQSQTARTSSVALDGDRNCLSGGSYSVQQALQATLTLKEFLPYFPFFHGCRVHSIHLSFQFGRIRNTEKVMFDMVIIYNHHVNIAVLAHIPMGSKSSLLLDRHPLIKLSKWRRVQLARLQSTT